jgi:hypothetical protein
VGFEKLRDTFGKIHSTMPPNISARKMPLVGFVREADVNRNRLIVGLITLSILMIFIILVSVILLKQWNSRQAVTGQREPLQGLSYCSSAQLRPCILSFRLDATDSLVINLLTERQATNVYLKVRQNERETIYTCQKAEGFSTNLACTGEKLPVGEALSFMLVSSEEDVAFAEGTFPIIGLAIATPDIFVTPTFIPAFDRPPK